MTRIESIEYRLVPFFSLLAFALALGCSASHHPTRPATLGVPTTLARMETTLLRPGPIRFERVVAADWEVARSGLINLDHPKAKAARLEDGSEPIGIYFYVLEHPERGTFIVD
jgi:N-acyl homoserine lactone hydrolase